MMACCLAPLLQVAYVHMTYGVPGMHLLIADRDFLIKAVRVQYPSGLSVTWVQSVDEAALPPPPPPLSLPPPPMHAPPTTGPIASSSGSGGRQRHPVAAAGDAATTHASLPPQVVAAVQQGSSGGLVNGGRRSIRASIHDSGFIVFPLPSTTPNGAQAAESDTADGSNKQPPHHRGGESSNSGGHNGSCRVEIVLQIDPRCEGPTASNFT